LSNQTVTRHRTIAIDLLDPHPKNYRIHTKQQLGQLQSALIRFGQVRSIVVQEKSDGRYLIVAGHGIVEAAKLLSWSQIKADVIDTEWSSEEIKAYLIADNRTSNAAKDDEYILLDLLQEQNALGIDLNSLGLYEGELDDLIAKLQPPTLDQLAETYGNEPKEEDFWPVVKVKVPPAIKERYDAITPQVRDETQKFTHLLDLAEEKEKTAFENDIGMLHIPASSTTQRLYRKLLEKAEGAGEKEQFAYLLKQIDGVLV